MSLVRHGGLLRCMSAFFSLDEERAGETVEAHPLPASDRPETAPAENATRTVPNEFDDEWESWS